MGASIHKNVFVFSPPHPHPSPPPDRCAAAELFALFSFNQTSGRGTGTPSQRDQDLQKENAKLASENLQLRFQLEQQSLDNKQIPRLKVRIAPVGLFLDQTGALHAHEQARALRYEQAFKCTDQGATARKRNVLWSGNKDSLPFFPRMRLPT